MKTILLLGTMAAALLVGSVQAQFIEIRLSYKAVLDPATGQRSMNFTDAQIDEAIAEMNALQATYLRGFRFVRVDPVWNIGNLGDTTGPSKWFNTDMFQGNSKDQMETAARADARYLWSNNAINIYLLNGFGGGVCSFPGHEIIVLGAGAAPLGWLQLHEIGHYFNLCHTQGCPCSDCGGTPGECNTVPGDDGIADTLPDLQCWDRDDIARNSFGAAYANLSPAQQGQVDDTFFNVMSYHGTSERTCPTERQLDRWTDAASGARRAVTTGRTRFVAQEICVGADGFSTCGLFTGPFRWARDAQTASSSAGGDMLVLRPGNYDLPTFSKPITLRATREGPATFNPILSRATP